MGITKITKIFISFGKKKTNHPQTNRKPLIHKAFGKTKRQLLQSKTSTNYIQQSLSFAQRIPSFPLVRQMRKAQDREISSGVLRELSYQDAKTLYIGLVTASPPHEAASSADAFPADGHYFGEGEDRAELECSTQVSDPCTPSLTATPLSFCLRFDAVICSERKT